MTSPDAPRSSTLESAGSRRRIIFWRHGRTPWNAQGRFQGQSDIALDEAGRSQAARAAALLAGRLSGGSGKPNVALISSDLSRALETAQALSGLIDIEVVLDSRLRETFGGVWQGLTFAEIEKAYPAEIKLWKDDEPGIRAGGGETRVEVAERMHSAIMEAVAGVPVDGTLVVVTHGGATRVALARLLGLPQDLWRTLSGLSNCHWSVVEQSQPSLAGIGGGLWRLTEHNVGTLPLPYEKPEDLVDPAED